MQIYRVRKSITYNAKNLSKKLSPNYSQYGFVTSLDLSSYGSMI